MRRRTVVRSLAASGCVFLSGCLGSETQTEGDGGDADGIRAVSIEARTDCPDAVGVSFLDDTVVVTGCVDASEGCAGFTVAERILIEGSFAVTIAVDEPTDADEQCPDDGVGYELQAAFDGDVPHTVSVVYRHDGMDVPVGTFTDPEREPSGE